MTQDDFTSGEYPDDGWGFDWGGNGKRAEHAGWVACHNHHMIWQFTGGTLRQLGERYLFQGDEHAAHVAGVLLARLAYIYPGMDMAWQQVRPEYMRGGRLLLDGPWERWDVLTTACQAYDAVFDYVGRDTALAEFLHTKDASINTPEDVKRLIECYLIQVFGADWLDRRLPGGSQGAREADMAAFAVCANMGDVSDRWIEELFAHAFNSGLNKGGVDDENLVNMLSRDGITLVNGFGYANVYLRTKSNLAEWLSGVKTGPWAARAGPIRWVRRGTPCTTTRAWWTALRSTKARHPAVAWRCSPARRKRALPNFPRHPTPARPASTAAPCVWPTPPAAKSTCSTFCAWPAMC
ncbi:MAG: hypothetical protein A3K19_17410 [Lentisphaerae bacterium RIFOXYB12_FULL_65_16]|nr:MAG: hypothetical protein A3K18_09030 [Lentisphaerae bacterium RIFOXYA12_64_32]OGV85643.1 MAG: hypothetical protein A3K19_17410 [Lentisphaerae bacterium RIFOXYB12_FULL_65_16]